MRFARGDLGPYRFTQKRPRTSVSLLQSFAAVGTPKSDLRAVRSALDPQRTSASLTIQRHFCRQRGLSVSSRPRALAYSISVCRAASQRSALVNSCVDITAPLTAPSQLMTIRTWVITTSSPSCLAVRAWAAANNLLLRLAWPRCPQAGLIARAIQISKTAPMKPEIR